MLSIGELREEMRMMLSAVMVFVLAVLLVGTGTLCGWWLRGRFQARSCGKNERDCINGNRADSTARAAGNDPQAGDWVARRVDFAASAKPVRQDPASAAVAGDPMANETAAPCIRNTFSLALSHRLAESARRGDPLAVVLARIDDYQGLGDRYGLQVCNQILDAAGRFFIASVRGMDWVARFDMTTFAFLLPNTSQVNALCVAERLRTTVSSAGVYRDGTPIPLTISLGTAEAVLGDSSEALLRRAEEAMHASIETGGNRIHAHADGQLASAGF